VFDNDGTLWPEKPMPVQLDFIIRGFARAAERDPSLRDRQPFKAAHDHDLGWLGHAMVKHDDGDDSDLKLLIGALADTSAGVEVEQYAEEVMALFADAQHPRFNRPYMSCAVRPMIELLRYLEPHGFLTFIVSGGERDFMRPAAERIYGIPRERVVGSGFATEGQDRPALRLVVRHDDPEREVDDQSGVLTSQARRRTNSPKPSVSVPPVNARRSRICRA
jgi:phosphoglycolate phosphatase-like HAD superfamily hydrolase